MHFSYAINVEEAYFFGANRCGDNEEQNNRNLKTRICEKCEGKKMERIRKENDKK